MFCNYFVICLLWDVGWVGLQKFMFVLLNQAICLSTILLVAFACFNNTSVFLFELLLGPFVQFDVFLFR